MSRPAARESLVSPTILFDFGLPGISFTSFGGLIDPTPRRELESNLRHLRHPQLESRQTQLRFGDELSIGALQTFEQNAAIVSAKAPIVFAVIQLRCRRWRRFDRVRARSGIDEAAEGSETDSGQAKVKRIVGDTSDSPRRGAGDIGGVE